MAGRTLADAIVLIALGTFLVTYAALLVAARNPDRRLPWAARGEDLVDGDVAMTLRSVGALAAVWGGTGLQRWVGLPLAPVIAVGPALVLAIGVRWLHHRRVAERQASPRPSSPSPSSPSR